MENIKSVVAGIQGIEAIELKSGKYRIEAILEDGSREIVKKAGNLPQVVQAYSCCINGNARRGSLSQHFNFAKAICQYSGDSHVKSFIPKVIRVACPDCGDQLNSAGACPNVL